MEFNDRDIILQAKDVTKIFKTQNNRSLTACDKINIDLKRGRCFGIVGESGCGKSTFVRMVMNLENITSGSIIYKGQDISKFNKNEVWLNRKNIQMIFQDAMSAFNPKMKIIDILTEPLFNFGLLEKKFKYEKAKELLNMVELSEEYLESYPHNLSGGQLQRIGIARAISLEPEILICDEATSALDVSVQSSIIKLLRKLQRERNLSILFICHDLMLVKSFSQELAIMYLGNVVEVIDSEKMQEIALHPYTKALLNAVFTLNTFSENKVKLLSGEVPSPLDVPEGCPFVNRCEYALEICKKEKPLLKEVAPDHKVACHLISRK